VSKHSKKKKGDDVGPKSKKKLDGRIEKIEKYLQDRFNWL
jgi:hypothetical protein